MSDIVIGITGGRGSGKSVVMSILKEMGYAVLSMDNIAANLMYPENKVHHDIIDYFGRRVLRDDGLIDRKILSDIVFNDKRSLNKLNEIMRMPVRHAFEDKINVLRSALINPKIAVEHPLVCEHKDFALFTKIVLVYSDTLIQTRRIMSRDNVDISTAISYRRSQMSTERKLELCDFSIKNNGDLNDLRIAVTTHPELVLS